MAYINTVLSWDVQLTNHEFLLVMKALGGRLKEEELEAARELDVKLTRLRAHELRRLGATAEVLHAAVGEDGQ